MRKRAHAAVVLQWGLSPLVTLTSSFQKQMRFLCIVKDSIFQQQAEQNLPSLRQRDTHTDTQSILSILVHNN